MLNKSSNESLQGQPTFSGRQWVNEMPFIECSANVVLAEVLTRISNFLKSTGQRPLVLFDLDGTLYENRTRSRDIARQWLDTTAGQAAPGQFKKAIGALIPASMRYKLRDSLSATQEIQGHSFDNNNVKENVKENPFNRALSSLEEFWFKNFFTNPYMLHDVAYPGAADFTKMCYDRGAEIVYLTGRHIPDMDSGTRLALKRDGFPLEEGRASLFCKPNFEKDDFDHKRDSLAILSPERVVASFENEPSNLIIMQTLAPKAVHIFMDTEFSARPAPLSDGLYRITSFENVALI